jgi:hypothetical protein
MGQARPPLQRRNVGREEIVLMRWRRIGLPLLALVLMGFWPITAEAAVLALRNETDGPVMVQGISVINRVARRGKLHLIGPGEVSQEPILLPGAKLIIVTDAKQPSHILCQQTIQFTGTDLFYAIQREQPDKIKDGDEAPLKAKTRKIVAPKVKLVPSKPTPQTTVPPPKPRH